MQLSFSNEQGTIMNAVRMLAAVSCVLISATGLTAKTDEAGIGPSFKGPIGLQLYSLREQFAKDVPGTLDEVREWGIKNVETAGTYKLTPEKFKAELDARGLKAISGHFPFERFRDDVEGVAREAKTLGMHYAGCAWIAHSGPFDEKSCREATDSSLFT
jgi:hypothetical protein